MTNSDTELKTIAKDLVACAQSADIEAVDTTFAELTTLRIGGRPAGVIKCLSPEALRWVVSELDATRTPLIVVGGGSNLVVGDGPQVSDLVVVWVTTSDSPENGSHAAVWNHGAAEGHVAIDKSTGLVRAYAGVEWDQLVAATVAAGLGGLECLSGIPGSVGATPVQNVGAYGAEVSQVLKRVQLYDREAKTWEWVQPEALDLAYRYSNLKFTNRGVVTAVEFQLRTDGLSTALRFGELARRVGVTAEEATADARRPVAEVREAVLQLRAGKGMVLDPEDHDTWSAGSFFTNPIVEGEAARDAVIAAVRQRCGDEEADSMPVYSAGRSAVGDNADKGRATTRSLCAPTSSESLEGTLERSLERSPEENPVERYKFSAAWLIERAGFSKGWHVEGNTVASLSTKHTLALTNRGGATSADIVQLARAVRNGVWEAFGVELEPEPIWLGLTI
ncbi:UDP-N-acetylmuramate dehydrogenase [Corynebacterium auriscanis]|uniref:UDP-N-acetylmuramate dehydrogenase n=1 Tax=Corynebacterium auriscanis TaxID=99807 RepID=UPI003CCC8AD9|nr:UDP-N-acetylenolpyruvoylglucosamine reductase [Corynebacterium auriscanis]